MLYPAFRRQELFVGMGDRGRLQTLIGTRLKPSGMFWTVRGANAISALRCCQLSGRFEDCWKPDEPESRFVAHPQMEKSQMFGSWS